MSSKDLGNYGENLARQYLEGLGYKILDQNFRNKIGELDLIAQDGPTVCFVEVKTRQSQEQGHPFEAVNRWKMRKMAQMAQSYLKYKFHSVDVRSRFDVIAISRESDGQPHLEHLKSAFDLTYL